MLLPINFDSERFLEGDFVQSNCVLRNGDKPIQFSWLFNGHLLSNSENIEISRMGRRSSILTLDPVKGHNRGNYTCTASNVAGVSSVHTLLRVNGTCRIIL